MQQRREDIWIEQGPVEPQNPAPPATTNQPSTNRNSGNGGSGGSSSSSSETPAETTTTEETTPLTPSVPDYSGYSYDSSTNQAYNNAMAVLNQAQGQMPQYAGTYDPQLDALYQQIVGRDKFSYDMNEDMFYQQAVDQYTNLGNMAMMDTMGQAAALTGGYGNTYAQTAGQQAYQGYLQQLNDNLPQFYQMALDAYNAEGDAMLSQFGLLSDLANRERSMYNEDMANYWQNIDYLQGVADTEYNRGYEDWYNANQMGAQQQSENYDRLVTLITTMGYQPTEQELVNAGMSPEQAQAYMNYYEQNNRSSSSSSRRSSNPTYEDIMSRYDADEANGMSQRQLDDQLEAAINSGYITPVQAEEIRDGRR